MLMLALKLLLIAELDSDSFPSLIYKYLQFVDHFFPFLLRIELITASISFAQGYLLSKNSS